MHLTNIKKKKENGSAELMNEKMKKWEAKYWGLGLPADRQVLGAGCSSKFGACLPVRQVRCFFGSSLALYANSC
jgi:hypothetical protein